MLAVCLKHKMKFPDTEDCFQSAVCSVLSQFFVLCLTKEIGRMGRFYTVTSYDYLDINSISESDILFVCTILRIMQSFCFQSRYLTYILLILYSAHLGTRSCSLLKVWSGPSTGKPLEPKQTISKYIINFYSSNLN